MARGRQWPPPPQPPPSPIVPVVESVPTHDNVPCVTSWGRSTNTPTRPKGSIQVYYTPILDSIASLNEIALKLHNSPLGWDDRQNYDDRLDVYSLPISNASPSTSESGTEMTVNERLAFHCVSHQKAEIAYRASHDWTWVHPTSDSDSASPVTNQIATPKESYIQTWETDTEYFSCYRRFLIVVDCEEHRWEEEGVLFVWFERKESREGGPNEIKEFLVKRVKGGLENVGSDLCDVRMHFNWQWQKAQWESGDGSEDG